MDLPALSRASNSTTVPVMSNQSFKAAFWWVTAGTGSTAGLSPSAGLPGWAGTSTMVSDSLEASTFKVMPVSWKPLGSWSASTAPYEALSLCPNRGMFDLLVMPSMQ